jgi:hypothetical protein
MAAEEEEGVVEVVVVEMEEKVAVVEEGNECLFSDKSLFDGVFLWQHQLIVYKSEGAGGELKEQKKRRT